MKISMHELKIISDYIIEELKKTGHEEVELPGDFYLYISGDERENMASEPEQCVGSLIDDWNELKKIKDRKVVTWVDIERFANILISVVEAIAKPYRNQKKQ